MVERKRIYELDFLRTTAILLMIIYHIMVDLNMFFNVNIQFNKMPLRLVGLLSALLFIFISGICSTLSRNNVKNGIKVFLFGMILTVFTLIFFKEDVIVFGILHLLGFSIFISRYLNNLRTIYIFIISIFVFIVSLYINQININNNMFAPLGIVSHNFTTLDFYPILPYWGVFLLGSAFGKIVYKEKRSIIKLPYSQLISRMGKNSLLIYLIHQPTIMLILYIIYRAL